MFRRALVLSGLLALSPAVSQAALLMLVDGVPGPATLAGYAGWFDIENLQWNIDRSSATPHSVHVTVRVSASTATLHQAAANAGVLKRIAIDQVRSVDSAALLVARLTCEEPTMRSTTTSHQADELGMISLDIRCARVLWEYFDYNAQTKTVSKAGKGSWNFKTNTP
jgi:hypothetical protein